MTIIIFLPAAGALALLFMKGAKGELIKWVSLGISLAVFAFSILLFLRFEGTGETQFEFIQKVVWIPAFDIAYHVGLDGISLLLIMLTTFLAPVSILSAFNAVNSKVKGFMISLLIMETGMLGVFAALDIFLFYVFWEAMLIPMYFLIGIWGGARRGYAALKFVLYTLVGSLLMLVAILALYAWGHTTDYTQLVELSLPQDVQTWMFLAFALSFAIKVPLFPLHTWLPDAHVEAPTAGSVILAGVLLKMGGYGFLRYCLPLFPAATVQFTPLIVALAVVGIIYGALVALAQTDIKKLVAYSSVSHLGFVVLGIFALTVPSVSGAVIQMVNHGLFTGALFLLVGMIYERTHTRRIDDYGGLAKIMPRFAVVFLIVTLASIGLPGLNGFVGEFLVLTGSYATQPVATVIASFGVLLAAIYLLWPVHRIFFGAPRSAGEGRAATFPDLSRREWAILLPITALIVLLGVYPQPFLGRIETAVNRVVASGELLPETQLSTGQRPPGLAAALPADQEGSSVQEREWP